MAYKCHKCGCIDNVETVMTDCVCSYPVREWNNELINGGVTIEDGEVDHYKCASCVYVLPVQADAVGDDRLRKYLDANKFNEEISVKVAKGKPIKCEESQKNTQVKCEKATYKITIYVKIADYIGESEREQDKEKSEHYLQSEVIEELLNMLEHIYMDDICVDMVEVDQVSKE